MLWIFLIVFSRRNRGGLKMFNKELNDFSQMVLPALAIPVVVMAWIIHTVSNRVVDYFCEEEDDVK